MTEPMFEIELYKQPREEQRCDRCLDFALATDDGLRVRGWIVYDGTSFTGKPLNVRLCPTCQRKGTSP